MSKLKFDSVSHTYTFDGKVLPSVTHICRFLAYDYKSDRPWLAQAAAKRGTAIHEACALIDYGEEPEETAEIAGYLRAYRRFLADYRPEWEGIERPLGSLALGYAGTPDRFGVLAGRRVLVDIKSGSTLRLHALSSQLMGYKALLEGVSFYPEDCYGLRLDRSGVYELRQVEPDFRLFSACLTIQRAITKQGEKP